MAEAQHTEIGALTKTCTGCHRTLSASLEFFGHHSSGKYGLQSACRECNRAAKLAYYRSDKGREAKRAYTEKNRGAIRAYNKSRPPLTAEQLSEATRRASKWARENRDKVRARIKKWLNTPEGKIKSRLYCARYQARRLQRDGEYALRKRTSRAIWTALRQGRAEAKGRWWEAACGYSLEQLREHLEKRFTAGMTWSNYGTYWEIDHVRPISGFIVPSINCAAFKEAWGLDNLRPLTKRENRLKGARSAA